MTTIHVNEVGVPFEVWFSDLSGADIDLSGASSITVDIQDPQLLISTRQALFKSDGKDGRIIYITQQGDIYGPGGTWRFRGTAVVGGGTIQTDWVEINVLSDLTNTQNSLSFPAIIPGEGDPPSVTLGNDGDYYLNVVNQDTDQEVEGFDDLGAEPTPAKLYKKVAGAWQLYGTMQKKLTGSFVSGSSHATEVSAREAAISRLETLLGVDAGATQIGPFTGANTLMGGLYLKALLEQVNTALEDHESRLTTLEP